MNDSKKMPNRLFNLVLEVPFKTAMPVDISLLENGHNYYNDLELIDDYTKKYSEDKIRELIKQSNIISNEYLKGNLYLLDSFKHKHEVMFIDTFEDNYLIKFIYNNINDKQKMNKLFNIYQESTKYLESNLLVDMKTLLNEKKKLEVIYELEKLPYFIKRRIMFYIKNNITK